MGKITLDADTFRALASSTRLTVLKALDERRKTLTELSRDLNLNKATVHEHMALLTAAGLVKKRDDEGRKWIYYELTWTGQRILHPEATTTFNLLLTLSIAAAGGGIAMLGRALGWWLDDTLASRPSDGAEEPGSMDRLSIAAEEDADSSADGAPAPEPASSGTTTQGATTASSSPEGGQAYEGEGGTGDGDDAFELYEDTDLGDSGGGPSFFDDGGWIGLALLVTCALFLGLALLLQRKLVPKPLDESSAEAAEAAASPPADGGGRPPPPPGSR